MTRMLLSLAALFMCALPIRAQTETAVLVDEIAWLGLVPVIYEDGHQELELAVVHIDLKVSLFDLTGVVRAEPADDIPSAGWLYYSGPNILETCYIDVTGAQRTITTNCNGMTDEGCLKKHSKMVNLMQQYFPPDNTKNCP